MFASKDHLAYSNYFSSIKSMEYRKLDDHLKRRVIFLLNEAKLNSPRDQAITFVMRVLSNHASVKFDGDSLRIKENNLRVSEAALQELYKAEKFEDWGKITINEHPHPLKVTWEWMKANASTLTEEQVWGEFINYPMVTVLRSEDVQLNRLGLRAHGNSEERYSQAGISLSLLDKPPKLIWKAKCLPTRTP